MVSWSNHLQYPVFRLKRRLLRATRLFDVTGSEGKTPTAEAAVVAYGTDAAVAGREIHSLNRNRHTLMNEAPAARRLIFS
jgi:hypothetical protein